MSNKMLVLPPASFNDKLKVSEAIQARRSIRQYVTEAEDLQTLANLCHFSAGITENTVKRLCANPTARNRQEVVL